MTASMSAAAARNESPAPFDAPGIAIVPERWETRLLLRLPPPADAEAAAISGLDFSLAINRVAEGEGTGLLRLGPDEWLFLAARRELAQGAARLAGQPTGAPGALIDVSSRSVAFAVSGPLAQAVLACGSPLDLEGDDVPPGGATRTLFGKCEVVLWRRAATGSYLLDVPRSFADYVYAYLVRSARAVSAAASFQDRAGG